jgi:hypothetical protein
MRNSAYESFDEFRRMLQTETTETELYGIRCDASEIPARNVRLLEQQLISKEDKLLLSIGEQVRIELLEPIDDAEVYQGLVFGNKKLNPASELNGLPLLNTSTEKAQWKGGLQNRVHIVVAKSSFTPRVLIRCLRSENPTYRLEDVETNGELVQRLASGAQWELAVLSEGCLRELCDTQREDDGKPFVLGRLVNSYYNLCGHKNLRGGDSLRRHKSIALYSFGGREATLILESMKSRLPEGRKHIQVNFEDVLYWLHQESRSGCFLAKDPLCSTYIELRGPDLMPLLQAPIRYYLFGSQKFLRTCGEDLARIYGDLRSMKLKARKLNIDVELEDEVKALWRTYLGVQIT